MLSCFRWLPIGTMIMLTGYALPHSYVPNAASENFLYQNA